MQLPYNFEIKENAPLEVIFDNDNNVIGKYILAYRDDYPWPIYIKFDVNNIITETYPLMIENEETTIKAFKGEITPKDYDFKKYAYISWDMKTQPTDLYVPRGNTIVKFNKGDIETVYHQYNDNLPINIEEMPDYEIECIRAKTGLKYKWVAGYSPLNPFYNSIKEKYFNF